MASLAAECKRLSERNCRLEARVQVLEQHGAARDRPAEAEKVPDGVEDDEGAEDVNVECTYTLNPSVWDAALIIGTAQVGRAGSTFALMLLLLNLVVQGVFVFLVTDALTAPVFSGGSITALREWRRNIAHSPRFADLVNSRTLASRVCAEEAGLEVSGAQKSAISSIKKFIGAGKGNYRPGMIMCCLCLLMWTLTVSKEINDIFRFARAVVAIPRGPTHLHLSATSAHLGSISLCRCCVILFFQVLRLALAGSLLVCGAFWLSYETDIPNLLLNAVALEFVFSVDELIFESLAPHQFRYVFDLCSATALELPPIRRWSGLDARGVLTAAASLSLVVCFWAVVMMPYDGILLQARVLARELTNRACARAFANLELQFQHVAPGLSLSCLRLWAQSCMSIQDSVMTQTTVIAFHQFTADHCISKILIPKSPIYLKSIVIHIMENYLYWLMMEQEIIYQENSP